MLEPTGNMLDELWRPMDMGTYLYYLCLLICTVLLLPTHSQRYHMMRTAIDVDDFSAACLGLAENSL